MKVEAGENRTFLELFKTLKGDLELIWVCEGSWVVVDLDAE
jgi:hypothetical protein